MKIIAEGAEAQIIELDESTLKKTRLEKKYRLDVIDKKLRKFRNKREFKVLKTLKENNINVPTPYEITENKENNEISFTFEYIKGIALKNTLNENNLSFAFDEIIKIHNCNITHGDLTTLNMLFSENKVYIIDFGLAQFSNKSEDKAVDLNLFFTCLKNEHKNLYYLKDSLIEKYIQSANNSEKTIKSLQNIEQRGRNK